MLIYMLLLSRFYVYLVKVRQRVCERQKEKKKKKTRITNDFCEACRACNDDNRFDSKSYTTALVRAHTHVHIKTYIIYKNSDTFDMRTMRTTVTKEYNGKNLRRGKKQI
jgi:hypothetical protein